MAAAGARRRRQGHPRRPDRRRPGRQRRHPARAPRLPGRRCRGSASRSRARRSPSAAASCRSTTTPTTSTRRSSRRSASRRASASGSRRSTRSTRRSRSSAPAAWSSTSSSRRPTSSRGSSGRELIQPLNFELIPNLQKNVWPELHSPFYDVGPRYSVPYTVYTTGIGWRNDQLGFDPSKLGPAVGRLLVAAGREVPRPGRRSSTTRARGSGMALMRRGVTDLNTEDPELLAQAGQDLKDLNKRVASRSSITDYETLPAGRVLAAPGWSGDMIARRHLLPAQGHKPDVLSYWYQTQGGPIFNDCICVAAKATQARHRAPLPQLPARQQGRLRELHRLRRLPAAADRDRRPEAVRRRDRCPKTLRPGRRHARGLRQRQRLPDALGQGPAALGPDLGVVPQRLMGSRWIWRALAVPGLVWLARLLRRRLLRDRQRRPGQRHRRCTSRSRTGTRWTGTSATSGRRSRPSLPGGDTWDVFVRTHRLRRRRGGAVAGDRLPGRLVRGAPRRALARADPRPARPAVLDQLPDADVRVDEPAGRQRLRGPRARTRSRSTRCSSKLGLLDGTDWLGGPAHRGDPRRSSTATCRT